MSQSITSRIAPTPSGLLHIGNAYNFLVTYREAVHKRQGKINLRIDDSDSARVKDEYIQDIFDTLSWLEIPYSKGPKDLEDFKSNHTQALKKEKYFSFLKQIPETFVCHCSRSLLALKQCSCATKDIEFVPQKKSIRLKVTDPELKKEMGDFVLWRKDDLPAYQLTSLFDDIENDINFIVRGEDLKSSSKAQFLIAELIGDKVFTRTHFLHHPLILDEKNFKISKTAATKNNADLALKKWREDGKTKEQVLSYLNFNSWEHFLAQ